MKNTQNIVWKLSCFTAFLLVIVAQAHCKETYSPPKLQIKEDRPKIKVEKETMDDTKSFGQFENKGEQERELASDGETNRNPSSNHKKERPKKVEEHPRPEPMRWKERRD